jgi:hypothetical protein
VIDQALPYVIQYADVAIGVLAALFLVKVLPTRWFSKEENIRHESAKRLRAKLRK